MGPIMMFVCLLDTQAQSSFSFADITNNYRIGRLVAARALPNARTPLTASNLFSMTISQTSLPVRSYECKVTAKGYITNINQVNPTDNLDTLLRVNLTYAQDSLLTDYIEVVKGSGGNNGYYEQKYDLRGRLTYFRQFDTLQGLISDRNITWATSGNHSMTGNLLKPGTVGQPVYYTIRTLRYLDAQGRVVRDSALKLDQQLGSFERFRSLYRYDLQGELVGIVNYNRNLPANSWELSDSVAFQYSNDTAYVQHWEGPARGNAYSLSQTLKYYPANVLRGYHNRTMAIDRVTEFDDDMSLFSNNFYGSTFKSSFTPTYGYRTNTYWTTHPTTGNPRQVFTYKAYLPSRSTGTVDSLALQENVYYDFSPMIVGLAKTQIAKVSIYPNPTQDYLMVKGQDLTNFTSAAAINVQGQSVALTIDLSRNRLDVRALPAGCYQLLLTDEQGAPIRATFVK